ncbi:Cytochrome P450 [Sesbania bispinosa]|nr:Cytochrome P450 [Sesbania bispinosa]
MWALCLGALIIIGITHWVYRWRNPSYNGKLPPGSMGLPLLGEIIQFFSPNTSSDIPPFIKQRMERYGPIFKTSVVGQSIVVSTDSDLNNLIFQQEGQMFESWYPDSFTETFGKQNMSSVHGFMYTRLISFPLDVPGTAYHRCLQEKGNENAEEHPAGKREQTDFFDYVIEELKKEGTILTEAIALDLMFVLLFVSFETTSLALTYAMKLLSDHPLVLKQLKEEHEAIVKRREDPNSGVTWQEYKSMTFTFQVIKNLLIPLLRENFRGIPYQQGGQLWCMCPPAVHLNPAKYEDPLDFNPQRWEGMELNSGSKNFFAKVQMAVFLHNLLTKYR